MFDVQIDAREFEEGLKKEALRQASRVISGLATFLLPPVRQAIYDAFVASPEYRSLYDPTGGLRVELGVEDPESALEQILGALLKSVAVVPVQGPSGGLGGLEVTALPADLSYFTSLPGASYTSVNKAGQQAVVPWLEWLLTMGDQVVLADYFFLGDRSDSFKASRTEYGIMVRRSHGPRVFRVADEFAGTPDDNWITRVLAAAAPRVADAVERGVSRA